VCFRLVYEFIKKHGVQNIKDISALKDIEGIDTNALSGEYLQILLFKFPSYPISRFRRCRDSRPSLRPVKVIMLFIGLRGSRTIHNTDYMSSAGTLNKVQSMSDSTKVVICVEKTLWDERGARCLRETENIMNTECFCFVGKGKGTDPKHFTIRRKQFFFSFR